MAIMVEGILNKITRKRLFLLAGILLVAFVLVSVFNYLGSGKLVVKTDDSNNRISIDSAVDAQNPHSKNYLQQTGKQAAKRLWPGTYVVSVKADSLESSQIVHVNARATTSVYISPGKVGAVEPVTSLAATNFAASASRLTYLNSDDSHLYQIDETNVPRVLADIKMQSVKWADPSWGVAQDTNGLLYSVDNGAVTRI